MHEYIALLLYRKKRIENVIDDHFFMVKDIFREKRIKKITQQITKKSAATEHLNKMKK